MVDVRPVGARALLVECEDDQAVATWRAELWRRRRTGELVVTEIVPGARTVLLDGIADPVGTARLIDRWAPRDAPLEAAGPTVEVPVSFDGADLLDVAARWAVDVDGVVARIAGTVLRVAFCGFAPGFAYLVGLPAELAVPRLAEPRARVPAGSVGLAGRYAGIYPTASPGGWRLVGRTDITLFDPHRDPPATLLPGMAVRLVPR